MVTRNVAQYPLHYVTYVPATFEVATSNGLEGNAIFFYSNWSSGSGIFSIAVWEHSGSVVECLMVP